LSSISLRFSIYYALDLFFILDVLFGVDIAVFGIRLIVYDGSLMCLAFLAGASGATSIELAWLMATEAVTLVRFLKV